MKQNRKDLQQIRKYFSIGSRLFVFTKKSNKIENILHPIYWEKGTNAPSTFHSTHLKPLHDFIRLWQTY